jgi:hypothetical protein
VDPRIFIRRFASVHRLHQQLLFGRRYGGERNSQIRYTTEIRRLKSNEQHGNAGLRRTPDRSYGLFQHPLRFASIITKNNNNLKIPTFVLTKQSNKNEKNTT